MSPSETLARAAAQTNWNDLPQAVKDQVCDLFVDTIAVSAAGLCDPVYGRLVATLSEAPGNASVPGLARGLPIDTAVQLNGGATTILQLQDGHRMGRGHPASHCVPVVLALAEDRKADATSVLTAFIAGYETGARIGIAMGGLDPMLHDTGTWSTIGAAVAAAHLLSDGDETVLAAALETAAATALMPYRDLPLEGASAHHLYIGLGATNGLMAARAAVAGMAPLPGTLENFFGPRAGAAFDESLVCVGVGEDGQWSNFEIENAYFKVHPTCAHLHGANDAITTLMKNHGLVSEDIETIEIATYAAGQSFDNPAPQNALAARFSLSATTAIAVCYGALNEYTLTDEAVNDSAVQNLMKRISVIHDPALDHDYPSGRPARVTVTRKDKSSLCETVTYPSGDHTNPLTRTEKRDKAARLLSTRFTNADSENVLSALDTYFQGGPIDAVTAAIRATAKNGAP